MSAYSEIRRHSLSAIVPVICFAAIGYFCYHAVEGDRGINAYTRLTLQIQQTETALAAVTAERQVLERRTGLLRESGLDTDMLEEQSRRVLGMIKPHDLVILGR
ncbi:FtsB family cell division protein [Ferrovibrio xuzhouensis]|uniref:Septum formation initiator family protein n=1 Tax=Ferrovibrio xuzhouensis TaxID=1576914 RepID=A0ABV7VLQ7_9PROT